MTSLWEYLGAQILIPTLAEWLAEIKADVESGKIKEEKYSFIYNLLDKASQGLDYSIIEHKKWRERRDKELEKLGYHTLTKKEIDDIFGI